MSSKQELYVCCCVAPWNAMEVTSGLWRVSTAYRQVGGLVTCGLTACTPGSASGPMLSNEYGKTYKNDCITHTNAYTELTAFSTS